MSMNYVVNFINVKNRKSKLYFSPGKGSLFVLYHPIQPINDDEFW